ncbi:MAG: glycosyltransferase [Verrucomicrobiales bacterium]
MKDLAVLITVYNDEEGLVSALDSIRETDNSFTVVVVDGASDPPLVLRPEAYPFETVLIRQEERSGIIGGLNEGLDYVRSQGFRYLARFDAGDLQRENRLGIQYALLEESEHLAMVGSNAVFRSEESGEDLFVTDLPLDPESIRKWSVFQTCFIHPTVMMRLDRIADSFRYETRYLHIEDYVLFSRIAERYKTANIDEPLVECFVREAGISRSNDAAQLRSGLRHHLEHPRPFNLLWHAYVLKRLVYLVTPYQMRLKCKRWIGFVKPAAGANSSKALSPSVIRPRKTEGTGSL